MKLIEFVGLAIVAFVSACKTTAPVATPVEAPKTITCPPPAPGLRAEEVPGLLKQAKDHGFLWKISKGGKTSYLYGTIHLNNPENVFPGPRIREAFVASDTVALEINPLKMTPAEIKASLDKYATPVDPAALKRVEVLERAECLDPTTLAALPLMLQASTVLLKRASRTGIFSEWAVDSVLAGMGEGAKRPVVALETVDSQFKALLTPPDLANGLAMETLGSLEATDNSSVTQLRVMFDAWIAGDFKAISASIEALDDSKDSHAKELQQQLFTDRNLKMADAIAKLHEEHRVFVAVGSGHMVGESGLPALMTQRGFQVDRVMFTP